MKNLEDQVSPAVSESEPARSVPQVAKLLGLSEKTVWRAIQSGKMGCIRPGTRVVVLQKHINDYVQMIEIPAYDAKAEAQKVVKSIA